MMQHDENEIPKCDRFSDISEYLDGELSPGDELSLEQHIAACSECRAEFNFQKQFHNILSSTLDGDGDHFELPDNFAEAIVTAAESNVASVRRRHEVRNAVAIVFAILIIAAVIASVSGGLSGGGIGIIVEKALAVIFAVGHLIYTMALGISVMLRSLTAGISDNPSLWLLVAAIGAFLLFVPIFYYRPRRSRNA